MLWGGSMLGLSEQPEVVVLAIFAWVLIGAGIAWVIGGASDVGKTLEQ